MRRCYILDLSFFVQRKSDKERNSYKEQRKSSRRSGMSVHVEKNRHSKSNWKSFLCFGKRIFGDPMERAIRTDEFRINTVRAMDLFLCCLEV